MGWTYQNRQEIEAFAFSSKIFRLVYFSLALLACTQYPLFMTNKSRKPSTHLTDTWVMFSGYDGIEYHAYVMRVKNGVAVINYRVPGHTAVVQAFISDASRLYTPVTEWGTPHADANAGR